MTNAQPTNQVANQANTPKAAPETLTGAVLLPDGKPAAGAQVAVVGNGNYLTLEQGKLNMAKGNKKRLVLTGDDGRFTVTTPKKAQIVAASKDGYAQMSLEQFKASPTITLEKWGAIEGTLRVGSRLETNVSLSAMNPLMMRSNSNGFTAMIIFHTQTPTDKEGHFAFQSVPPGDIMIQQVKTDSGSFSTRKFPSLTVKSGETTVTNINVVGRTVTGKIKLSDETVDFKNSHFTVFSHSAIIEKLQQSKGKDMMAAYASEEGQNEIMKMFMSSASVSPDGSFRMEAIPAGNYDLNLMMSSQQAKKGSGPLQLYSRNKEVPEARGANDDSIVDWGTVELKKE